MRPWLLAWAALATAEPAPAQTDAWDRPPPPWEGVWRGTIGSLPVHVCLNNTPYRDNGAYYYDRHRALIALELSKDRSGWRETGREAGGPRWTLSNQSRDRLIGTWSDGARSLPVALSRIGPPSQEFEGPCGTLAFHQPRLGPLRVTEAKGSFQGQAITTLTFRPGTPFENVEVNTFTIDRSGAAAARVNADLRAILPKTDGSGDWLDCMMSNANAHGADGEFGEAIEPTMINPHWLGARQTSGNYCGGAHPNHSVDLLTFDLDSGARVDPLDWFLPSAVKVERFESETSVSKTLTPAFRKVLTAGYAPGDSECADVIADQQYWTAGIARGAVVFWPQLPHVATACGEELKMPLARLGPWLNARGKAAVATLPR